MTSELTLLWTCNYCGSETPQHGPRSHSMPPIPPDGWIRVDVSRFRKFEATKDRPKGEELQTVRLDACPKCKTAIEDVVLPPSKGVTA